MTDYHEMVDLHWEQNKDSVAIDLDRILLVEWMEKRSGGNISSD